MEISKGMIAIIVLVSITILLLIFVFIFTLPKDYGSVKSRPTGSSSDETGALVGEKCTSIDACAAGLYCGQDSKCHAGDPSYVGQNCFGTEDCLYGLNCKGNFKCAENTGTSTCVTDADCSVGKYCFTNTCASVVSSAVTVPSCTRKGVWRTWSSELARDVITSPPSNTVFFTSSGEKTQPTYYGCANSNGGDVPIYAWLGNKLQWANDLILSKSNTVPSPHLASNLYSNYSLQNGGLPVMYIYSNKLVPELLPLYILIGTAEGKIAHTTATNQTTIQFPSEAIVRNYNLGSLNASQALLGYVYTE
jgi:hypothetical protein